MEWHELRRNNRPSHCQYAPNNSRAFVTYNVLDTPGFCLPHILDEATRYKKLEQRITANTSKPLKLMEVFPMTFNTTLPSKFSTCNTEALGNSVASFGLLEVEPDLDVTLKRASLCALVALHTATRHSSVVRSSVVLNSLDLAKFWRQQVCYGSSAGAGQIMIWNSQVEEPQASSRMLQERSGNLTLPRIIQPPGGVPRASPGTTLIQIGFNDRFNYSGIVMDVSLMQQIFTNTSALLAASLGLPTSHVSV